MPSPWSCCAVARSQSEILCVGYCPAGSGVGRLLVWQLETCDGHLGAGEHVAVQGDSLRRGNGVVGVCSRDDEYLAVWVAGIGANGDGRRVDRGDVEICGNARRVFGYEDHVTRRDGSNAHGNRTGRFSETRPK